MKMGKKRKKKLQNKIFKKMNKLVGEKKTKPNQ